LDKRFRTVKREHAEVNINTKNNEHGLLLYPIILAANKGCEIVIQHMELIWLLI